jgi:hypothetical protein
MTYYVKMISGGREFILIDNCWFLKELVALDEVADKFPTRKKAYRTLRALALYQCKFLVADFYEKNEFFLFDENDYTDGTYIIRNGKLVLKRELAQPEKYSQKYVANIVLLSKEANGKFWEEKTIRVKLKGKAPKDKEEEFNRVHKLVLNHLCKNYPNHGYAMINFSVPGSSDYLFDAGDTFTISDTISDCFRIITQHFEEVMSFQ